MDSLRRRPAPRVTPPPRTLPAPPSPLERFYEPKKLKTLPIKKEQPRRLQTHSWFRWIFSLILGLIFLTILIFGYFSWKVGQASSRMNSLIGAKTTVIEQAIQGAHSIIAPVIQNKRHTLLGEESGRTNILLLGKADDHSAGHLLTDTIIIVSLDFEHRKVALLSLPRDLYVKIPGTQTFTKLNAIYQYDIKNETGSDTVRQAVQDITSLPIHYFAALDYSGFKSIIDALGGVNVSVERDLYDPRYPGPNYSYETFEIKKGWQKLDGETALKYVRERHNDPEGDFGRAKRQQSVLQAMRERATSLKVLLNPIALSNILDTLGDHIRTDIPLEDIETLAQLSREFDTKNISTAVVDAWKPDSLLRVSHVPVGNVAMFILVPRSGNWNEIQTLAENIFSLDEIRKRKEAVKEEDPSITLINASGDIPAGNRIARSIRESLDIQNITILSADTNTKEETTIVIPCPNGTHIPFTIDSLSKFFSASISEDRDLSFPIDLPKCDVAVMIGKDAAQQLSFEEDSIENFRAADQDAEYQQALDQALKP